MTRSNEPAGVLVSGRGVLMKLINLVGHERPPLGVEYGIVLAIIASMVDHLRHGYSPAQLRPGEVTGRALAACPARARRPHQGGLVVYRFGTSLYYANATKLLEDL